MKNYQEAYEKPFEMSRNNDYITGDLLDHLYHQSYYKRIDIDLSRHFVFCILQVLFNKLI